MAVIHAEIGFLNKLVEEVASPSGGINTFDYSLSDVVMPLSADTLPSADDVWAGTVALTAGAATVSLTSLARTGRTALDLTNKRVLFYIIKNLGANSMTFTSPGTNAYAIFTTTNGHIVQAGGIVQQYAPNGFGTVGASAFNITVAGTGTQTFALGLIAGTP